MIAHRVASGRWERAARDVFTLAGTGPTWLQDLMIAFLAWGPGTVVSHRAAAALWRLVGFEPGPIELIVPLDRRRMAPGDVHRHVLDPVDVVKRGTFAVTTPARTLIDVAGLVAVDTVEEALDDVLRRGLASVARLRWRVEQLARSGRPGIGVMRALLEARDPRESVPQNVFERRLLRELLAAGLPPPVLQHQIRDHGRLIGIVDFAYPDALLAIETDGHEHHSSRAAWEHDRLRRNRLTALGWQIIHVTWRQLDQTPDEVTSTIARALDEALRRRAR